MVIKELSIKLIGLVFLFSVVGTLGCRPDQSKKTERGYAINPVPLEQVDVADNSFWGKKTDINRNSTIPHIIGQLEKNDRITNFELAAAGQGTYCTTYPFDDTDAYKLIEAASYAMAKESDPRLDQQVDSLIAKIAASQQEDGYIYSYAKLESNPNVDRGKKFWWGNERWEKVSQHSHELYNAGHLIEAAVAHYKATGKRNLLDVAIKFADLITKTFGPGDDQLHKIPGHEEIELALVKLYEVTGEQQYLDTADYFLEQRGHYETPDDRYRQNHKPVKEQSVAVGHSVRAAYLYSGMADVGAWTDDMEYVDALKRIWNNVVSKKLYIIGGIGSTGESEGFGPNYDLPNSTSYNETCAAIANSLWNYRMFKLSGDAKYIDVMERSLYNNVISGVSLDGSRFFYPNRLRSDGGVQRQPWFTCACCPPNAARTIASMPQYIYAQNNDTAYVNLFVENTASFDMNGTSLELQQQTNYPWEGKVQITVNPEEASTFTMKVRVPGWARNEPVPSDLYRYTNEGSTPTLSVNGESQPLNLQKGYAVLTRNWAPGDQIELQLPMDVHTVVAHDSVTADRGKIALERGPFVYAVESVDNGDHVLDFSLDPNADFTSEYHADMLNGVVTINGTASYNGQQHSFTAIPYYSWANRGDSKMAVWLNSTQ